MLRRFRAHDLRPVTDLRGVWDFTFVGDASPDEIDVRGLEFDDVMAIPGCFDATPAYAGRRGLAAYRTRAMLPDRNRHRLLLDDAHQWWRVSADADEALRAHRAASAARLRLVHHRHERGAHLQHEAWVTAGEEWSALGLDTGEVAGKEYWRDLLDGLT
jgi:hypothetical protein